MSRLLSALALGVTMMPQSNAALIDVMQPVVDQMSEKYNCSIAVSLKLQNGTKVSVIAGDSDPLAGTPAKVTDKFVWGSVTKTVTGTNVLQAADRGLLKITDPIAPHVDPILKEMAAKDPTMNFSSLEDLFGPEVHKVTIENCARMMSGIPDYDTATPDANPPTDAFRKTCYAAKDRDYAPQDMLGVPWVHTGQLDFPPGTEERYSSTNFVLLGLLLAQLNHSTWKTFDQGAVIPPVAKQDTVFAVTGGPSEYTNMHGFDRTAYNGNDPSAMPGRDISDVHCVYAGWTASDYTASVEDAVDWCQDVYGPNSPVLSPEAQALMPPSDTEGYGWSTHNLDHKTGINPKISEYGRAYGHLGATYGFDSIVAFFPALNMSMAVASNIETTYQTQPAETTCLMYNQVRAEILGKHPLTCTYSKQSYYGRCECI